MTETIRSLCRELAKQHGVSIEFKDEAVPKDLASDVSLCLFRVAQEALHNALKYSGVKGIRGGNEPSGEEVWLVVGDAGGGFDVAEARRSGGLGLVSTQERIHLVQGRLYVQWRPCEGTTIIVCVPVREDGASAEAKHRQAANMSAGAD